MKFIKIEQELEQELDQEVEDDLLYEKRELKNKGDIFRHKVETFTRSKPVLLAVVTLNVIDCIFVSLELFFDFLYFTGGLESSTELSTINGTTCFLESGSYKVFGDLSHYFHYASIAILSFLVLIMFAHVYGSGKRFFRYKLHTCDSIVIIAVLILDVTLFKGINSFSRGTAIWILICILMLRVLRLLNSLVVILVDGQRLQIRVMYTTKKKLTGELEESKTRECQSERQLENIRKFCLSKGLENDAFETVMQGGTPLMYINGDAKGRAQKGKRLQEYCQHLNPAPRHGNIITRRFKKLSHVMSHGNRLNNRDLNNLTSNSPSYDETTSAFSFDEAHSDDTTAVTMASMMEAANNVYENRVSMPISRTSLHRMVFESTIELEQNEADCVPFPEIVSEICVNSDDIQSPKCLIGNNENDIYDTKL